MGNDISDTFYYEITGLNINIFQNQRALILILIVSRKACDKFFKFYLLSVNYERSGISKDPKEQDITQTRS
jgi:hypothetical protein